MDTNIALIVGRLTRDPELKALTGGGHVANFSVATGRHWKDKNTGEKREETDFHNVVVYGVQADSCAEYLKKGQLVSVEGRMQTRSWEGENGVKHYRTEIVASGVHFGPKSSNNTNQEVRQPYKWEATLSQTGYIMPEDRIEYPTEDINLDDIPF